MPSTQQILGIRFFDGPAADAVATMCHDGGLLVVPAAPALVNIQYDEAYRAALIGSDVAIADSGFMVLLWKILRGRSLTRVSGLAYLEALLTQPQVRERGALFLVLPTNRAREKALAWFRANGFSEPDCYVAPHYAAADVAGRNSAIRDESLLQKVEARHPAHIVIAIGGGTQEKLGLALRDSLSYRPAIHCIGAALGFVTGDQKPIPKWADRFYLGWLLRLARNPRLYFRRFWVAHELPGLIARYGSELPPMKKKLEVEKLRS